LLADALQNDARALRVHHDFNSRVVPLFPKRWTITRSRIVAYVDRIETEHNSIAAPSIQPSSRSRFTKALVHEVQLDGEAGLRKPMVGSFAGCCARAASGNPTTLPPSADMNCRLAIPIAICPLPNGIMLAAISERISRPDRQVCDRLHAGPTTKSLLLLLRVRASGSSPFLPRRPFAFVSVMRGKAAAPLAKPRGG
jgi:hypothetical protein